MTLEEEDSIPFPLHLQAFLFPSSPKLRAILFLFRADLRAKSTTFSNLSTCYAYFL